MPTIHFFLCGYSFQNELGFQRDGKFLWLWVSNRGEQHLLEDWKVRYALKTPDDDLDDRFVEVCQMHDRIEYLTDILTVGDLKERVAVVDELMRDGKIAFLQGYTVRRREEDVRYERENDADRAL